MEKETISYISDIPIIPYLKNSRKKGIYILYNYENQKLYVGSTSFMFKSRRQHHFYHLKLNKHSNKFLQNDYNNLKSKSNLEIYILELMNNCLDIEKKEQLFINLLKSNKIETGYNIRPTNHQNGFIIPSLYKQISSYDRYSRELIKTYESLQTAVNDLKISYPLLSTALNSNGKHTAFNYLWAFGNNELCPYSYKGEVEKYKPILQLDINENIIKEVKDLKKLFEELKINNYSSFKSSVYQCCIGKRKTVAGFKWKWKDTSILSSLPD